MSADRKPFVSSVARKKNLPRRFRSEDEIETAARSGDRAVLPLLIRALGDQDPALQRAACDALPKMGEAGFQSVLRAAARGNKRERESAVWMLGTWGDVRALSPLLLALHHDGKERRLRNLGLLVTMVGLNIVFFAGALYSGFGFFSRADYYDWNWYQESKRDVALRTRAAIALGRLGDVRAIVPLIRLMRDDTAAVSNAAQDALCQLMPIAAALPPDQFRALGEGASLALAGLLAAASDPLARSTLGALSVCCDPRTLPAVQSLADDATRPVVQTMAQQLALRLQEYASQEQLRTTLLRGSASPHGSDPDQLLRAAHAAPLASADGSQLLRPTVADQPLDIVNS